jgi:hypothetical protein
VANVLDYVAAWNEPDAATRLKILERCWADDGAYVDPNVELKGRPGARLEMMSGVELHHHVVRFLWRLVRARILLNQASISWLDLPASKGAASPPAARQAITPA